jgi:hypothetical protein
MADMIKESTKINGKNVLVVGFRTAKGESEQPNFFYFDLEHPYFVSF